MKRHRVLSMDFDARANLLGIEVKESWDPTAKESMSSNQASVRADLLAEYGAVHFDRKLENFRALGAAPFSVIAFHNQFFRQARDAFVIGSYYPALTGACALGERVLNHLILALRNDFSHTPEYKRVHRQDSFDNWSVPTDALTNWGVLLPEATELFRQLRDVRNRTLHFNPATDRNARPEALTALVLFQEIVSRQFSAFDGPWYIPNAHGLSFIRRDQIDLPFVRRIVLPSCRLVGPAHDLRMRANGTWEVIDDGPYPEEEISDEDFVTRFVAAHSARAE
jgi:hypothetical protein